MTAWITCSRCHGAQTLAVQGEDYEQTCPACDGEGALLDDGGDVCVEADAPEYTDADVPLDVLERDAGEWDGRRRRLLARATAWREVRR